MTAISLVFTDTPEGVERKVISTRPMPLHEDEYTPAEVIVMQITKELDKLEELQSGMEQ